MASSTLGVGSGTDGAAAREAAGTNGGRTPPLDPLEIASGLLAFVVWILLMTAGITVAAQDYIDPIREMTASGAAEVVGCLLVIATCHTVTNTAMLCCVSAFLGVLGNRVLGSIPNPEIAHASSRRAAYLSAVIRGFFVFLVFLSGTVALSDQAFINLSLDRYIRLVGLSSLFSFTVGYNPDVFSQLMARVNGTLNSPGEPR
ncbi:hypothetical protein [Paludisphaera sp.]|uniref:hypothetical protein n=1 Tax=Paludisphaera sp. TaxID=2017432 RepID=UPI00301BC9E6